MQLKRPISYEKTASDTFLKQLNDQSGMLKLISYLIFFILIFLIDIALLFLKFEYFPFTILKLSIHLAIIVSILIYNKKFKSYYLNILILITKLTSLLYIILIGKDYQLIILFILEENQINVESWDNFAQRALIKIGCLLFIINKCEILNVLIMTSVLSLEILKGVYLISINKTHISNQQSIQKKQFDQKAQSIIKEASWVKSIAGQQQFFVTISRRTKKIISKNQNFQKHFSILCLSDEELDELILKKFKYTIINDNIEDQKQTQFSTRNKLFTSQNHNQTSLENSNWLIKENSNLIEILDNYNSIKFQRTFLSKISILEFYCQYFWSDSKLSTFTGQIIFNQDEDEIILTLIDITKENKFQEERIKDQFKVSVVQSFSHELRTPLNSSINFLQYCENDTNIDETIKSNFICPAINALRLQSYLINDIIDFSSLQNDNFELDMQTVTVEQIVDEVNKLFKSSLKMKNLALFIDLTKNQLKQIGTDFSRLIQIIANFLQNSIKYSNTGQIILKITSSQQNILKISIKDQGIGIDLERLKQIKKMLVDVEQRKKFSSFQSWQGFGLLISSMLIMKLRPDDQKSIYISSRGQQRGTKVIFYIKNNLLSSQIYYKDNKNKFGTVLQPPSNHTVSFNGSLIQISELDLFKQNKKISSNDQKKSKFTQQGDSSALSNSLMDLDFELQIAEIHNFHPFLFSENQNEAKISRKQISTSSFPSKVLNYEKIRIQEQQENEQQLKNFFKKMNCACRKVLSIDDEIFNQKSIQFLLQQYGFEVILAFNGQEAIKIINETQKCSQNCCLYLLILMDYQMPIMNGLQTTVTLKQMMIQNQIPQIYIIGLTAFNSKNDIELCMQSGMNAILKKPLKIFELLEIIKQI